MLTDRDLKDALDDLDVLIRICEKSLNTLIDTQISSTNQDTHQLSRAKPLGSREIRNALALLKKARKLILSYRVSQHHR